MPRSSLSSRALPSKAATALEHLGARLRRARIARGWTLSELAARMFVTSVTLRRLESGNPGTSLGVLATSLFLFELLADLDNVASLNSDRIAASQVEQRMPKRARASRKTSSSLKF